MDLEEQRLLRAFILLIPYILSNLFQTSDANIFFGLKVAWTAI